MKDKINKILNNEKVYWLWAAIISMVILLLSMSYSQVLGNGKYIFINSDLYKQVAAFTHLYYQKLLEHSNMYYSFRTGLGTNITMLVSYIAFSPFNILYIFSDIENINLIGILIFVLKTGFCASCFQLYSSYNLSYKKAGSIVFSVCYSLISFNVYINRMYTLYEAVYLLPLICIAIKYLVDNKKIYFLTIMYSILFVSNFYGGYVVGLVTFIYFVYYLVKSGEKKVSVVIRYFISVALAFALSAFLIFPTLYEALTQNVMENSFNFHTLPVWDILQFLLPFHTSNFFMMTPFFYCGIPCMLLMPAFFFNKNINKKSKIIAIILIVLAVLVISIEPLYAIAHMLNDPTGYTFRFAYVISFFIMNLCIKAVQNIDGIDKKKVLICNYVVVGVMVLGLCLDRVLKIELLGDNILLTALAYIFVLVWIVLLSKYHNDKYNTVSVSEEIDDTKDEQKKSAKLEGNNILVLMALLLCIELCINNVVMLTTQTYQESDSFNYRIKEAKDMIEQLKANDSGKYRVIYEGSTNQNQASLLDYYGFSYYSSSTSNEVKNFMHNIGVQTDDFTYTEIGLTDLALFLSNSKYTVHAVIDPAESGNEYIKENEFVGGWGFVCDKKILDYQSADNVFENQNNIVNALSKEDVNSNLFDICDTSPNFYADNVNVVEVDGQIYLVRGDEKPDGYIVFQIPYIEGKDAYAWFSQGINSNVGNKVLVISPENHVLCGYTESALSTPHVVKMSKEDDYYSVIIYMSEATDKQVLLADYSFAYSNNISDVLDVSGADKFEMQIMEDGYVKGQIVSDKEGILFLSIPYENGWNAKLNGQNVEIVPLLNNTFIGLEVKEGVNEIELSFEAPYSDISVKTSLAAIIIVLLCGVYEIFIKKQKK